MWIEMVIFFLARSRLLWRCLCYRWYGSSFSMYTNTHTLVWSEAKRRKFKMQEKCKQRSGKRFRSWKRWRWANWIQQQITHVVWKQFVRCGISICIIYMFFFFAFFRFRFLELKEKVTGLLVIRISSNGLEIHNFFSFIPCCILSAMAWKRHFFLNIPHFFLFLSISLWTRYEVWRAKEM